MIETQQNKTILIKAAQELQYFNGATASGDALKMANDDFHRNPIKVTPRVAVLFTDGYSNIGASVFTEATRLKNAEVSIFSIGIGSDINMNELNTISSVPSSKYVKLVKDFQEIYSQINYIASFACDTILLLIIDSKVTAETSKDELKKYQLDLVKNPSLLGYYEIDITNVKGFTQIDFPTFYTPTRSIVKADWFYGPVEKLTKDGEKVVAYFVKVPDDAQIMYFDAKSRDNENTYNLLIDVI